MKLKIRRKAYFIKIARGLHLGYRRNRTAGAWLVRVTKGGVDWTDKVGTADDYEEIGSGGVLNYEKAYEEARKRARIGPAYDGNTVGGALDRYEDDLKERGGDVANVQRVRLHLPPDLGKKIVGTLITQDLRDFRTMLAGKDGRHGRKMSAASINRTCNALRAALNHVADLSDGRIPNRDAWKAGLKALDGIQAGVRNVILGEAQVRLIIASAYRQSAELGLYVELMAVTGARPSQLERLQGEKVELGKKPCLMMPTSKKGKKKEIREYRVPILDGLARRLVGRTGRILSMPDGNPWTTYDRGIQFGNCVEAAGYDRKQITLYALRHSSIVRQLQANVPIRIVAATHDTSVEMIEKVYSRFILDHSDDLARGAMLDTTATVQPLRKEVLG